MVIKTGISVSGYVNSDEFVLNHVKGKVCLHLGCIGETCASSDVKVARTEKLLHYKIARVAKQVVGIDHDKRTIDVLKNRSDLGTLVYSDVENLNEIDLPWKTFEVIIATAIIEHLNNPGKMLEGIRHYMTKESLLLISAPNMFGLPNYLRFVCRRYREGPDHVVSYNKYLLSNLLARYGFSILELYSCYGDRSKEIINPLVFRVGYTFLKIFPELGVGLIAMAKLCQTQVEN